MHLPMPATTDTSFQL